MDYGKLALELHEKSKGKIAIQSKIKLASKQDLSTAYTPGVAEPCKRISENKDDVYKYTSKGNMVAIVTDGSAVLGLGDIGPEASLPVMEGKAILFKEFADVDAIPIAIASKDVDEITRTVKLISPGFGGINLEDISAPRCFEIERRLIEELDIPVFHDDQHGTAIVVLAALINALQVTGRAAKSTDIVVCGSGAAGIAITRLLQHQGFGNITLVDSTGAIYQGRTQGMNPEKEHIAKTTNKKDKRGDLAQTLAGADVFIGVSAPGILTEEMIKTMNKNPIVFAMANPIPEIMPELAIKAGSAVVATGRSDYPNQINNVLAFPGVFRGALDARAKKITTEMKVAAAIAIASMVEPTKQKIIPDPFTPGLAKKVAEAVTQSLLPSS